MESGGQGHVDVAASTLRNQRAYELRIRTSSQYGHHENENDENL